MMRVLLALTLWWTCVAAASAGQLLRVNAESEFDTLRLSLELSAPTQFRYSLLDKPDRLLVELTGTDLGEGFNPSLQAPPVTSLRHSRNGKNLRLVFELSSSALVKAYKLKASQQHADRVVLELSGYKALASKAAPQAAAAPADGAGSPVASVRDVASARDAASTKDAPAAKEIPVAKEPPVKPSKPAETAKTAAKVENKPSADAGVKDTKAPKPVAVQSQAAAQSQAADHEAGAPPSSADTLLPTKGEASANQRQAQANQESHAPIRGRKIIVALDAGHGGKDTGAVGARGVREKDVVLAIARELAALLNQDGRYKVVMTRAGDQFIPLKGRRDKARKLKADVFVSIHADAFVNAQAKGASVFALSQRGATSEMARFLAEHENSSDLLGSVGGVSLGDKDEVLAGVLVDLSMTATLANSLDLGGRVLKELGRMAELHNRAVEQAGFVVLKSPDVPSILVETGFISNPEEAAALNSAAYRQKLAQAIYRGLNSYFATQAPAVTQGSAVAPPAAPEPRTITAAPAPAASVRPDTPKIDPRAEHRAQVNSRAAPSSRTSPDKTGTASAPGGKPTAQNHRVDKGDTLEKIARRYGVSQKVIMQANGMPNATVKLGQTLLIPVP